MAKRYSATEAAQKMLETESEVESEESEYGESEDEELQLKCKLFYCLYILKH